MLNEWKKFLADERGGALEYALVSTLAAFASVAALLFQHADEANFVSALRKKIVAGVEQINGSLR